MMRRTTIFSLLAAPLLLTACADGAEQAGAAAASEEAPAAAPDPQATAPAAGQRVAVEGGAYRDVSVSELQTMLAAKDFPLINVHVPFEGDLPDTDGSIPFEEIANHLDQLPADRNAKVVLYCRSGRMSAIAAETLVKLGYTDVYNLVGGFNAWQQAGLPMAGG